MKTVPCPTCGTGTIELPDPIKDHVCNRWCGDLHHRYSHAIWKDRQGIWHGPTTISSMNKYDKEHFTVNLPSGSWPCMFEERLRETFKFIERKSGALVEGAAIDLT